MLSPRPARAILPADALAELAARINAEHNQAEAALKKGLQHAKNAGDLLIELKKQCKHGEWLPTLKRYVKFSDRTAQAYMRVSRRWGELEAKSATRCGFALPGSPRLAGRPATPLGAAMESCGRIVPRHHRQGDA
jgi:hypothetical protein